MGKNRFLLSRLRASATGALCLTSLTTAHSAVIYSGSRNAANPAPPAAGSVTHPQDLDGQGGPEISLISWKGSVYVPPYSVPSHLGIGDGMIHYPGGYRTVFSTRLSFTPSLDFVAGRGIGYLQDLSTVLAIMGVDTPIGPDSVFSLRDETTLANSYTGARASDGYFGFRFNPTGDQTLYGWGRITIDPSQPLSAGGNIVFTDWAYDDSGAPIRTGQVPEPSGALLAGLTALTAAGRRRRPAAPALPPR